MLHREPLLVTLLLLIDEMPWPQPAAQRRRGRPNTYCERLIVKALVIMIIRRLYTAYSLLAFLEQETELTCRLRELLTQDGRFPSRRTWERRLAKLPDRLPGLVGCLGRHLVTLLQPWAKEGCAAVVDSTALRAKGGVWHQKDRALGGALVQVWLSRLVVWLETPSRVHRLCSVDSVGRRTHPSQCA